MNLKRYSVTKLWPRGACASYMLLKLFSIDLFEELHVYVQHIAFGLCST